MTESMPSRKPLLSIKQVTIAIIFGTLALITTGMGLALPSCLPWVNFELHGTFIMLATMSAGPIVGIVVSFLVSLVSAVGVISFPFYWSHIFVFAYLYKKIYGIRKIAVKSMLFWIISALALFIQYWGWWWLYAEVFKITTVEAMFWYNMFGDLEPVESSIFPTISPYIIYLIIWTLIPYIVLIIAPDFARPDWEASGMSAFAIISSIITIVLGILSWGG